MINSSAKIACLAAVVAVTAMLAGCETNAPRDDKPQPERSATEAPTPAPGDTSAEGRASTRSPAGKRSDKGVPVAPEWVDEECTRYKNLFDGRDFGSLAPSRERLVSAGKPGVSFLVKFLLARSMAKAVGDQADQAYADRISEYRRQAESELLSIGEPALDPIYELAVNGQTHWSAQAAQIMGLMGEAGVSTLARAADKSAEKRRTVIVQALGNTGSPRAVQAVARILEKDPSWQVRGMAAGALGPLGRDVDDGQALAALERAATKDEDPFVVEKVAKAVVEIDDRTGLRVALVCMQRFLNMDPPQLEQAKALAGWMGRKAGTDHGVDVEAWKRVIR